MKVFQHNLRNRILLLYAIIVSLSLIALSSILYLRTSSYLRTTTLDNLEERTALLQTQLDQVVDHYKNISDGILGNVYLHSLLIKEEPLTEEEENWLDTYVGNLTYYENLDNAMIVDHDDALYLSGPFFPQQLDHYKLLDNPIMESAYLGTGRNEWHILPDDIFQVNRTEGPFIYLERKMRNLDVPGLISGYSVLQLSKEIFDSLTVNIDLEDSILQIVYDEDHTIFFDSRGTDFYPSLSTIEIDSRRFSGVIDYEGRDYFVSYNSSEKYPFSLVNWVPYDSVSSRLLSLLTYSLYILLGTLLCILVVGYFFSSNISRPIETLSDVMRRFGEGDIEAVAEENGKSEMLMLQKQFNEMSLRIRDLLVHIEADSEEKRNLEMKMLRYQINPHFLYNFLDSLNWLALEEDQKRLSSLITAMARFYRLGLMTDHEIVSLEEEIEYTRYYLVMAQFRSGDAFTFDDDIPEELSTVPIIRMGLQPLIENAIKHGFSFDRMTGCHISITAEDTVEKIIVTVRDNGGGLSSEEVDRLNRKLCILDTQEENRSPDHVGMRNVNRRLKLHFGDEYGLSVSSDGLGTGMAVHLHIPREI